MQETLARVSVLMSETNGDIVKLKQDGGLQYNKYKSKEADGFPIDHFRISQGKRVSCIYKDKKLILRHYGMEPEVNKNP